MENYILAKGNNSFKSTNVDQMLVKSQNLKRRQRKIRKTKVTPVKVGDSGQQEAKLFKVLNDCIF